ncbi:MAG: flagellar basal body rod protein FlgB [Rhodospirillaceae bacterium]
MDLGNFKIFRMAQMQMDWAAQRQKVLAQNIANADTPGYRPSDVRKPDFKNELMQHAHPVKVARTNPKHMAGTIPEQQVYRTYGERKTFEESPDGNKVIIEEQMEKVGSTRGEHSRAVALMKAHMRMLKMAMGGGGGGGG